MESFGEMGIGSILAEIVRLRWFLFENIGPLTVFNLFKKIIYEMVQCNLENVFIINWAKFVKNLFILINYTILNWKFRSFRWSYFPRYFITYNVIHITFFMFFPKIKNPSFIYLPHFEVIIWKYSRILYKCLKDCGCLGGLLIYELADVGENLIPPQIL